MKRSIVALLLLISFGCSKEGVKSFLNADLSVGSSFIPPDFFDPIPIPVATQGASYHYAKPVCASNCNITLPTGKAINLNDLGDYFNTFDGDIRITGLDYQSNPIYFEEKEPEKFFTFTPSDPDGRNPNFENISDSQSKTFSAEPHLKGQKSEPSQSLPTGANDFQMPEILSDQTVEQKIKAAATDQQSQAEAEAKDQAQFDKTLASMKADIEKPFNDVKVAMVASFAPTEKAIYNRHSDISKSSIEKSDAKAREAQESIRNADFSSVPSAINSVLQKSKIESEEIIEKLSEALPNVEVEGRKSSFKTSPLTLEGKAIQRADGYISYAEKTIKDSSDGQGKIAASSLISESKKSLAVADDFFAKGESDWGEQALRVTYALADTAVALAPIAALAIAPSAVVVVVGLEALNIAKSWYEYKTGRHLFSGETLTETGKTFSLVNVVAGFIPAGAVAAANIAGMFRKSSSSVAKSLQVSPEAKVVLDDTSEALANIRSQMSNLGDAIPGTSIPKYFRLKTEGVEFFVNPNATKHMGEYINSLPPTHGSSLRNDLILSSFEGGVKEAVRSGAWKTSLDSRDPIISGGWELIFSKRPTDELPVIIHALMKK